jgi:hypothetical protein
MSQTTAARAQRARKNSAYVRMLLRQRQPAFAAALAAAEQYAVFCLPSEQRDRDEDRAPAPSS